MKNDIDPEISFLAINYYILYAPVSVAFLTPVEADSAADLTLEETLCFIFDKALGSKTDALRPAFASR